MLTLTRRIGETIELFTRDTHEPLAQIVVKQIRRSQVRIGIVSPIEKTVILRGELEHGGLWSDSSEVTVEDTLPDELIGELKRWLDGAERPGPFLDAVLCNNLARAVDHATDEQLDALPEIVALVADIVDRHEIGAAQTDASEIDGQTDQNATSGTDGTDEEARE